MIELYRYFSLTTGPFEKSIVYSNENEFHNHFPHGTFDPNYHKIRISTEEKMYKLFIKKGGKPITKHPKYLVVGNCDEWFKGVKKFSVSLSMPLSEIDPSVVSFTYGDSIPCMNGRIHAPYAGQLFVVDEIQSIIEKYGLPQEWNPLEKNGLENYIEVQIWSDEPFKKMTSDYARQNLMEYTRVMVSAVASATKNIKPFIGQNQIGIPEMIKIIINSQYRDIIRDKINSISPDRYESNRIHGVAHAVRCTLYCATICIIRKIPIRDIMIALDAASSHDIGRTRNVVDHGKVGADLFHELHPFYDDLDLRIIMAIIHAHSLDDSCDNEIMDDYNIPNERRDICRQMITLIKDCDSLDYIRLGVNDYDPRHIHCEDSRRLIRLSMELNLISIWYPNEAVGMIRGLTR